jgi:hypothetical protein
MVLASVGYYAIGAAVRQRLEKSSLKESKRGDCGYQGIQDYLPKHLISLRTKEALAAKKGQGIRLGKPSGTIQKSKFDQDKEKIKELLDLDLSVCKIAKYFGYHNHISLNTYVKKNGSIFSNSSCFLKLWPKLRLRLCSN